MDEDNYVDDDDDDDDDGDDVFFILFFLLLLFFFFFLLASFQQLLVQDNAWNAPPKETLTFALNRSAHKLATNLRRSAQLIVVLQNINIRIALVFMRDSFADALTVQVCEYSSRKYHLRQKSF